MKASKFFMLKRKREEQQRQQVVEAPAIKEEISTPVEVTQVETVVETEKPVIEPKKSPLPKKKA